MSYKGEDAVSNQCNFRENDVIFMQQDCFKLVGIKGITKADINRYN